MEKFALRRENGRWHARMTSKWNTKRDERRAREREGATGVQERGFRRDDDDDDLALLERRR